MRPSSNVTRPRVRLRVHRADNVFQHLQTLKRNRTKRHHFGEALVEGVRPITRAIQHGWQVVSFAFSADRELSGWAREMLAAAPLADRIELTPALMERLSEKEEPSELMVVVRQAEDTMTRIELGRLGGTPLVCVFDRPSSPGNLGTIIRSCDALGADGLLVTGHGCDVYDPQTIRASQGSLFAIPVVRAAGAAEVRRWADLAPGGAPLRLIGASGDADRALADVDLTGPMALVLGNETHGLSQGYREVCDDLVQIPMPGQPTGAADSLNVASAASILLYETARQRASTR
ncbi:MAG: TrmH family RNA methyltransferase [Chloroflexota bacterium]